MYFSSLRLFIAAAGKKSAPQVALFHLTRGSDEKNALQFLVDY